jgi:rRNA-processing protein FCF1
MFWEFREGATAAALREKLTESLNGLGQIGQGNYDEQLTSHLMWARDARLRLAAVISAEQADALIYTRGYWALTEFANQHLLKPLVLVWSEANERRDQLRELADELAATMRFWASRTPVPLLPDTNLFLHHREDLDAIDWHGVVGRSGGGVVDLVVPLVVVDELDRMKRANEVKGRARATLKRLNQLALQPLSARELRAATDGHGPVLVTYLAEARTRTREQRADDEIVTQAKYLQAFTRGDVQIVTFDTGMELRAKTAGVGCFRLDDTERAT